MFTLKELRSAGILKDTFRAPNGNTYCWYHFGDDLMHVIGFIKPKGRVIQPNIRRFVDEASAKSYWDNLKGDLMNAEGTLLNVTCHTN